MFDSIFSIKTGYKQLDKRIELTKKKKDALLVVLEHPEIPIHNNPAELIPKGLTENSSTLSFRSEKSFTLNIVNVVEMTKRVLSRPGP